MAVVVNCYSPCEHATTDNAPWDVYVPVYTKRSQLSISTSVDFPGSGGCFLSEIAMKLVMNAATTGGHILKGKVSVIFIIITLL